MPSKIKFDPADVGDWPVPKDCELINGMFVELPTGARKAVVSGHLMSALMSHCDDHNAGWVFPATLGYRFFPETRTLLRKVSISFVRRGRFPGDRVPRGDARIPPDLAVIVIAPGEKAEYLQGKIVDFLSHGTRLMWVLSEKARLAFVHRPDGTGRWLREDDYLDGEVVLPGFRCRLGDILLTDESAPDEPIQVPASE